MKYETYVTSGYKYGLLNYPGKNLPSIRHAIEQCVGEDDNEQCIEPRKDMEIVETIIPKTVVPFEDVDGLTLEELTDYPSLLYRNRYLVFVMYDSIPVSERSESSSYRVEFEEPQEKGKSRYLYVIDTEQNKESTIDEVVEKQLKENMGRMNVQNRRRALGFLEKYVHSDRVSTIQAINTYLDSKGGSIRQYFQEYVKLPKRLINQENK